jgi:hypothetical protein
MLQFLSISSANICEIKYLISDRLDSEIMCVPSKCTFPPYLVLNKTQNTSNADVASLYFTFFRLKPGQYRNHKSGNNEICKYQIIRFQDNTVIVAVMNLKPMQFQ